MHLDPLLPLIVGASAIILVLGLVLRTIRQPALIGYLIAGVLLGPDMLGLFDDVYILTRLGEFGVILLLFFVGMEISLPRLIAKWRIAVLGTLIQIAVSVGCAYAIGAAFDWSPSLSVLLGFVMSLSSTAVVLKVLQDRGELDTEVGQDVTGVLLVQDLALVPMLIVINLLGGETPGTAELVGQAFGGLAIIALLGWLTVKGTFTLPLARFFRGDHELEVFSAFLFGFALATLTGFLGLSAAVGAFVAGIVVTAAQETSWIHTRLEPFRVVFVALFFVSIGMLVDLDFVVDNWLVVVLLALAVITTNTLINGGILKLLGLSWQRSMYAAAILSQIGEFSFVLAAVGLQTGTINQAGYQMVVAVIALTLLVSPFWFSAAKHVFVDRQA